MTVRRVPLHKMLTVVSRASGVYSRGASRCYSAVQSNQTQGSTTYVSPFREIFDNIREGKTFMGTSTFSAPEVKYLKCGCPEQALKFKTTSYGRLLEAPFVKPNEHRVTLQVETHHIPMTDMERLVLKEIVGSRLDDETGLLQLSSSQFGSRIENKRHAVSMLERIIESAKTLAAKVEDEAGLERQEAT
mmetsp:Transcript_107098/g.308138  ORF Transcript_107098/g.308138 Transcript_107098/m.308138 type:complete len:189 (+) Transcript_107098:175-741(+)